MVGLQLPPLSLIKPFKLCIYIYNHLILNYWSLTPCTSLRYINVYEWKKTWIWWAPHAPIFVGSMFPFWASNMSLGNNGLLQSLHFLVFSMRWSKLGRMPILVDGHQSIGSCKYVCQASHYGMDDHTTLVLCFDVTDAPSFPTECNDLRWILAWSGPC